MRSKKEKIWMLMYTIFAKNLPKSAHFKPAKKLRCFYAKRVMISVGKDVNIEKGAMFNGQSSIGDKSGVGIYCELNGPVTIGKYVNMGPEVIIYTRNHGTSRTDIIMQEQGYGEYKPVVIEDDVWIGRRVIILPGVTIGKGSVVGAGSVVAKSVPPYSVAVGNPAKVIKNRLEIQNG